MIKTCTCDISRGGCTCGAMAWEKQRNAFTERYVAHIKKCRKLELSCVGSDGFFNWTCCEDHKGLAGVSRELKAEATSLLSDETDGQVLSANWWKAVGRQDMFDFLAS